MPIENSSNGTVVSLLDLLADAEGSYPDVRVCAEHYLSVQHYLLAAPTPAAEAMTLDERIRGIKTLYTHPQVWTQCTRYLAAHLAACERIDTSSTSAAASHLLSPPSTPTDAAIGSRLAGVTVGLTILASNIEDDAGNTTRFLVLQNSQTSPGIQDTFTERKKCKSLITFTLNHAQPGSLADALQVFKSHGFNLTSIDTRPSRQRPWHYIFCVECEEVDAGVGEIKDVTGALARCTERCRYLGTWEDALPQSEDT